MISVKSSSPIKIIDFGFIEIFTLLNSHAVVLSYKEELNAVFFVSLYSILALI